jgi:hypothetical protein
VSGRSLGAVILIALVTSCAPESPRGLDSATPVNLHVAASNFRAAATVRVRVQLPGGRSGTANVRLPDRIGSGAGADIILSAAEAVDLARSLDRAIDPISMDRVSIVGSVSQRWQVSLDGKRIVAALAVRDALPRQLEVDGRIYTFFDYNAVADMPP